MIHTFTPEFFFYHSIPNHQQHKEIILPKLEKDKDRAFRATANGTCITTSTLSNFDLFHEEFVREVIWNPFNQMLSEFDIHLNKIKLTNSKVNAVWWNYYEPNEICHPHRHYQSDFTGIYLLHLEEPNPTRFLPTNNSSNTYPLFDGIVLSEQCVEGDVLIFPGKILHWTVPITTPRWIVAFDINVGSYHKSV
jgi:hypothetical protein